MSTLAERRDNAHLTVDDLRRRISERERLQLIDVRSPGEFAAGHIPGAVNIPMEQAEARLADMSRHEPVVLVCQSGNRAGMTCEWLSKEHPEVLVLEGGTHAWVEAGEPVVRSTSTRWSLERQVRLTAGLLVLAGVVLSLTVNPAWLYLSGLVGLGLTFAGLTNVCGMAALFSVMPWNKAKV